MSSPGPRSTPTATSSPETPTFERHYAPGELGELWGLSADTIRRLFEHEPDVLVIKHSTKKRRYRTLRIPESVAARVHRRMSKLALD